MMRRERSIAAGERRAVQRSLTLPQARRGPRLSPAQPPRGAVAVSSRMRPCTFALRLVT